MKSVLKTVLSGRFSCTQKERAKCSFVYWGAHNTALRASRDSKGAQLLGARFCLQSLVRYTVQAGDRAKQPARLMGSAGSRGTDK